MLTPVFSVLHLELVDHARIKDSPLHVVLVAPFALLALLLSPLLLLSCSCWGEDYSFFFLGIAGGEYKGGVD